MLQAGTKDCRGRRSNTNERNSYGMRIIAAVFIVSVFMTMIAGSALAVPVGTVTEADIISFEVSQAAGKKMSDIMSSSAASIPEDTKIQELGKILADRKVPSLFVLNKDSQPIGTVSSSDVLKALENIRKE